MYDLHEISQMPEWNQCLNLLLDDAYSEIEVNGPNEWFTKKKGKRVPIEGINLETLERYYEGIKRGLVPFVHSPWPFKENSYIFEGPLRYKVNEGQPDEKYIRGRCHIVMPPAADYPQITIAKKSTALPDLDAIAANGSMSTEMLAFLKTAIKGNLTIAISGGTGAGKALSLDTPIPTPIGWSTMGELKVGDKVFDHHGNVGEVINKFPQPKRQVYKVKFSTGEEIYCDAEHNWWVSDHNSRIGHYFSNKISSGQKTNRLHKTVFSNEKIAALVKEYEETPTGTMITVTELRSISSLKASQAAAEALEPHGFTKRTSQRRFIDKKAALAFILVEWATKLKSDKTHKTKDLYHVMTTEEMFNFGVKKDKKYNFQIPVLEKAIQYERNIEKGMGLEPNELPIHPYLFGLWLGDGASDRGEIAALDSDGEFYSSKLIELSSKQQLDKGSREYQWKIVDNNFRNKLDQLGIKKKGPGHSKKLVNIYEFASEESRRLLIAGMIDSDGWASKNSWGFGNTNRNLIDGFYRIVSSLGYKASISKEKFAKYKNASGELVKTVTPSWSVSVQTNDSLALLPRKIDKHKEYVDSTNKISKNHLTRAIIEIEPVKDRYEEMACITVDTPDSTYLAGHGYITTHNTTILEAMTKLFSPESRIGVAEDAPELSLVQKNVTYLHSVPWAPGMNPNDVATLSWVVSQYQRMRTDKIIIGETRGVEFSDFLVAANSGMDGSLTTLHANDPVQCLDKMTNFALRATNAPVRTVNNDIANSIDLIIQLIYTSEGQYRTSEITEITTTLSNDESAKITTNKLYSWQKSSDTFKKESQMTDFLRRKLENNGIDIRPFLISQVGAEAGAHSNEEVGKEMIDMATTPKQRNIDPVRRDTEGNSGLPLGGLRKL